MGMPDSVTLQRLMDEYSISHAQAIRFYWYRVEGFDVERALKLARTH